MQLCLRSVRILSALVAAAMPCLLPFVASGLVIDGYTAATNDRFANDSSFIAADYDLAGVAIAPNGTWLTMVAPNVYLTADHFKPADGAVITFYSTNDPNGPSVTRTVTATRERFGTSDLVAGMLDKPLPEGYAVYNYATETISNISAWNRYPYRNQTLFHVGRSPNAGAYAVQFRTAVGQNQLTTYGNFSLTLSGKLYTGMGITANEDAPGSSAYVPYETFALVGDSGAPLFFRESSSSLRVVGIAWFNSDSSPRLTGFTAVGNYSDGVDAFIAEHGRGFLPAAPGALEATAVDLNTIALSWNDLSAIETGYEVERAAAGSGAWNVVATLPVGSHSFVDSELPPDTAYDYRVRAFNAEGPSNYSAIATASTLPVASFGDWQVDAGLAELSPEDAAPDGDPDGDGIVNLLEYALGGDPLVPSSAELPVLTMDDTAMNFTFLRLRTDVVYRVIGSFDLVGWSTIVENPGEVGEYVTVVDPIAIHDNPRRFLRLEVVLPSSETED